MKQLILASGSPRRSELLEQVGIPFIVKKADIDESKVKKQHPVKLVETLACLKGNAIEITKDQVIVSADTVVSINDKILTKPNNPDEALRMLTELNGNKHVVYTGVMMRSITSSIVFSIATSVQFWQVSKQELEKYITSNEPFDKAGGYGIQGKGAFLVKEITGDYFNVVGLPISAVVRKLKYFDIHPTFN